MSEWEMELLISSFPPNYSKSEDGWVTEGQISVRLRHGLQKLTIQRWSQAALLWAKHGPEFFYRERNFGNTTTAHLRDELIRRKFEGPWETWR